MLRGWREIISGVVFLLLSGGGVLQAQEPKVPALEWWSLQPVRRSVLPKVRQTTWVRNPMDAFVLSELEKRGWKPAPPADRATLLRRVTYDLIGLPPTPTETDAFLADTSPNAYTKVIDRLLADPRYGERWGRHWLDVARFGESQGFERDKIRDHAWRYRDYVIRAFNQDKPYAQFVREQIAGDVLEPTTQDGILATGFLVGGPWDEVGHTQQSLVMRQRVREEELEDMVAAVGQTFLGLSVNCARCHNHKFDPIPTEDYYRIKAALEGVFPGDRIALTAAQQRERDQRLAQLQAQRATLQQSLAEIERAGRGRIQRTPNTPLPASVPLPVAQWTFEEDGRDSLGALHGTLKGGAVVRNGRLLLNGTGAYLETVPLPREVRGKTLEAWVIMPNRTQRGGGVLSLEATGGGVFDALVFGELEPGKWMAGSEFLRRSRNLVASAENAGLQEWVHLAIVYSADHRIAIYRNGVSYGDSYLPDGPEATLRTYLSGQSHLLIGLRHTGAGNGFLAGEVEEARFYDRPLTAAEVAASFRAGPNVIPRAEIEKALTADERTRWEGLRTELQRQEKTLAEMEPVPLVYGANPRQPEPTFVLTRGDVESKGAAVTAGGLSCVATQSSDFGLSTTAPEGLRRRKLAEWITHPANPLTPRVLVNRVWHYHFGRGIVASPSDFGLLGERPSHPALLDWLASEFLRQGGRIKALHRLILLSNTYRQSAKFNPIAAKKDAETRLLWRFPPHRLEGEAVRDAMLALSGQLNPKRGGPSFRPFTLYVNNSNFYTLLDTPDPEFNRRTVYRIGVQSAKHPMLETLDCPDPSTKTPRRVTTTTPLQALELMNNSFVLRQAQHFAERVQREAGADPTAQVKQVYRLAFGRLPTTTEQQEATLFLRQQGLKSLCWACFNATEFLYTR